MSLTRNFRLPKDASITGNHGISDAYGTVARITLDGDKLSNNFKLTPVRGLIDPSIQDILSSGLKRVDRKHNENEELLTGKRGYNLSKYVKSVEVLYRQEFLSKNDQDTIEKICHKKGVALSFLRMWEPVKEDASYHVNEYLLEGIL